MVSTLREAEFFAEGGVRDLIYGEAKPARTVVPVPELHHGYLVEIEAIAARTV